MRLANRFTGFPNIGSKLRLVRNTYTREINHLRRLKWEYAGTAGLAHSFIREDAVQYSLPGGKSCISPLPCGQLFPHLASHEVVERE
jgi:hypothetical protein